MNESIRKYLKIALLLIVATVVIMFFVPTNAKFPYSYEVGGKWRYETLYADVEFPILKTDAQISADTEKNSGGSIPCYQFVDNAPDGIFSALDTMDLSSKSQSDIRAVIENLYRSGVLADNAALSDNQEIYIQREKRIVKCSYSEVYKLSEARAELMSVMPLDFNDTQKLVNLLQPNLSFNSLLTEQMKDENTGAENITDGYVSVGDIVVRQGELITPELVQILNSYREEYNDSQIKPTITYLMLYAVFILSVLIILFLVVNIICPEYIGQKPFLYILTVFVIFTIAILLVARNNEEMMLLFPFTLIALLLQAFFPPKLVIPVFFVCLLPMTLMTYIGPGLFILYTIPGIVSVYLFKYFCKGWKQFLLALIIFTILALINLIQSLGGHATTMDIAPERAYFYLFIGSFLTVAGYPLVYLFERIFNLTSNSRLVEITDTSSSLIRRLESAAPGTLQHSLQVMNMADYVGRAVGANVLLLKAGALYHDIGKMNNPMCFVENESLLPGGSDSMKYHSSLSPLQSATDIIRHVSDGVELAEKDHLPESVIDFIRSHHGTSLVRYFYAKHIELGGSAGDEPSFHYQGMRPLTKEQVILMLCDSVEAASRTLKEHTTGAYDAFISGIYTDKFTEGQFADADISIKELSIVKESLKNYLVQMHHERIVYPNRKDIK